MPRVIRRRNVPHDFVRYVQEYLQNRSLRERSSLVENHHKGVMMDVLSEVGVLQDGGHRTIHLDDPLVYVHYPSADHPIERKVTGIERKQRSGRMALNEERVLEYLQARGLVERCTTTIQIVNEDEVLAANYDGTISDDDLKGLYDEAEPTYAFYLITDEE